MYNREALLFYEAMQTLHVTPAGLAVTQHVPLACTPRIYAKWLTTTSMSYSWSLQLAIDYTILHDDTEKIGLTLVFLRVNFEPSINMKP